MLFTQAMGGVQLHLRMCARADAPLSRISKTAGLIVLNLVCGWGATSWRLQVIRVECIVHTCASAHPFFIPVTAARFVVNFGVLLNTH